VCDTVFTLKLREAQDLDRRSAMAGKESSYVEDFYAAFTEVEVEEEDIQTNVTDLRAWVERANAGII
jgi:hypothetical protein